MSAQNVLYSPGNYQGTTRYATSSYGSAEQLLQDLRSELLVEKEKRLAAENRADDLAKQLTELQESSRVDLFREGERRRDAEKRIRDLDQQLRVETEARKKSTAETLPREQHLLQRGTSLHSVDRVHVGQSAARHLNGLVQHENDRQRIAGTDVGHKLGNQVALNQISSLNHNAFGSSSSSHNKGDDVEDEEWQFIVRHNTLILKNSKQASRKLTRNRFPDNHSPQKPTSASAERRNNVTHFGHQNESQGNRPVATEHVIWRAKSVHERTQSPSQVNSGNIQMTEQVSKREGSVNARGTEHMSRGGVDDNGISCLAEHTGIRGRTSNWPGASERSEDELKRQVTLIEGYGESPFKGRINEAKKLQGKKIPGTEKEDVIKDLAQDSVTATISQKDATYVTDFPNSSSLSTKTDIYADPAFKTRLQRKIFWEQKTSTGEIELHVQSSPGDKAVEESGTTTHPVQRVMKLRAKWDTTPSYSEA